MLALSAVTIFAPRIVRKSFAVESFYVGVYWDPKCTREVTSINWGELTPGSTNHVTIFLRNEVLNQSCFLSLWAKDWSPPEAANYLFVHWDYDGKSVALGEVVPVTLTLKVARNVIGITDFNFSIVIFGTEYLIGDIDRDGTVNIYDAVELAVAYGSTPSSPYWNPQADLNGDNIVDIFDVALFSQNYGVSAG